MRKTELLLARLDAIGASLARCEHALMLLGLGSVGAERDRLDEYSDLDFFVVVVSGHAPEFLADLGWLSAVRPIVYQFRNTPHGYKLLFDDDVFCEFAVVDIDLLPTMAFAPGRVVWKRADVDEGIAVPRQGEPAIPERDTAWFVGEAVTNLYVGLLRERRGEKLSAARFVQQYAVDRILELSARIEAEQPGANDWFTPERRYERRFPHTAQHLASFIQGYGRTRESAEAILAFLEQHFEVDPHLARRIRELI